LLLTDKSLQPEAHGRGDLQKCLAEKRKCGNLKNGIGSFIVEPKTVEDQQFVEESRTFYGQAALDVGDEEDELVAARGWSFFFSRRAPDPIFLLGKKADASESSQIINGDVGPFPVGGDLVRSGGGGFGRGATGASGLAHLFGGWTGLGVAGGARAGAYRIVLEEDEGAVCACENEDARKIC
jgi:hypothetical protein